MLLLKESLNSLEDKVSQHRQEHEEMEPSVDAAKQSTSSANSQF